MRAFLHRFLVCLVAIIFVAAGIGRGIAAAQPCPDTMHEIIVHHAHDGGHHHAQPHDNTDKQTAIDQSCLKCCGVCIPMANGVAAASGTAVLILSTVLYLLKSETDSGQPIVLDPGIPKTIS